MENHWTPDWTRADAEKVYAKKVALAASLDRRAASDFREYMNDYLTVSRWAYDHGMTEYDAEAWLKRGKVAHNRCAESRKH